MGTEIVSESQPVVLTPVDTDELISENLIQAYHSLNRVLDHSRGTDVAVDIQRAIEVMRPVLRHFTQRND